MIMRSAKVGAIGAALLVLGAAPVARAQDAAFLLGERETTVLIVVHGDSFVARRGAGLVVPLASGWWRVGVDRPGTEYPELRARLYPRWRVDSARADSLQRWAAEHPHTITARDTAPTKQRERDMNIHGEELGHDACFGHVVWAVPLGEMPALPDSLCAPEAEPAGSYSFTFVSPSILTMYAGITTDYSYNFTRGTIVATLDAARRHSVTTMGGQHDGEHEIDPDPAFGVPAGDRAWAREALRCNLSYNRGLHDDAADSTETDYVGTWIKRTPGRWRFERYYANTSYVGRGHEDVCIVRVPVPTRLTGWDRLTVPWSSVRRRYRKAIDAFTSPNGAVAIVIDSGGIRVVRLEKGALGRELGSIAPDNSMSSRVESTTMSQWATGASAGRWEAELAAVLPVALEVREGETTKR
ncbi:MAG: hypothetical protein HOQ09_00875 [Gemmatimonadaceae bacterium]|nr:hypothetical protein [Gemmatimonadaceae bacterium]